MRGGGGGLRERGGGMDGRSWMEAGGWMGWRVGWGGGRRLGAGAWMEEWRVLDGEEWRDGGG